MILPALVRAVLLLFATAACSAAICSPTTEAGAGISGPAASSTVARVPAAAPQRSDKESPADEEPLQLEEPPAVIEPLRPRTEADWDRIEALARFSAGRALEREGKLNEALRQYQRAWRYDGSATAAQAAVRLALSLRRPGEAARIVLGSSSVEAFTATQLMEVGVYLFRKGQWQEASNVLERLLQRRKDTKPTLGDVALRVELGRLYFLLEQPEKAAEHFAFVAKALDDPQQFALDSVELERLIKNRAAAWRLFGRCFLQAGRHQQARDAFRKAHRLEPDEARLGYHLAAVAFAEGHAQQALKHLEDYFQAHASSEAVAPYELLVQALEKLDKQQQILPRLEKLHNDDPDNAPLGYFLAEQYLAAGKFQAAETLYRKLLEKRPTAEGYRGLAQLFQKQGRVADMLALAGRMMHEGGSPELLDEEDQSPLDDADWIGKLIAEARRQQEAPSKAFTTNVAAAAMVLALKAKQFDAARRFFNHLLEKKHPLLRQLWLRLGAELLTEDRFAEAAELFQLGIDKKIVPEDDPLGYYFLSGALEMAGKTDEALRAAQQATKLDRKDPRYLLRVGWILYHAGRNEEARATYLELIERFDQSFHSDQLRQAVRDAKLALSSLAVESGDLHEAERWLEEVLDEFPDDVSALNDLGYLWADRNTRLQRAYRMIKRAVEAEPDNAAYRDSLGWVLYRLGRLKEAAVELERAAAAEADPVIFEHLGDVHHALGQLEQAKQNWQKAIEAFQKEGKTEQVEKVRKKLRQL